MIWRPAENNAQMRIRESEDGSTWSAVKYSAFTASSTVYILHIETAGTPTRYIEIAQVTSSDFYLDAIVFNAINLPSCRLQILMFPATLIFVPHLFLIAPALIITDAANQTVSSAYVQIGTGFVSAEDRLSCTNALWDYIIITIKLMGYFILRGEATTSQYQSVLRSVIYNNISGTPTSGIQADCFFS